MRRLVAILLVLLVDFTRSNANEQASSERVQEHDIVFIAVGLMKAPDAGSDCWAWVSRCTPLTVARATHDLQQWVVTADGISYELEGDWEQLFHRTESECFEVALKDRQPEVLREDDTLRLESSVALTQEGDRYERLETACGWFIAPPFAGWVLYRPAGGIQVPVTDAEFSKGSGWIVLRGMAGPPPPGMRAWLEPRKRCSAPRSMKPLPVSVDSEGHFSVDLGISTSTTTWQGEAPRRWETYNEDPVIVLRAPGCDDLTVHFAHDWKEQALVMTCPGRTALR